ncbi:MAG: RsmB/NOP family class I SAM-dependent RNA methyltransferase [Candidatus Symbiothrix sp.]|jgi:16S rRNA C967 or C1407 C5-methylase (RsmB/RsmF family)/NOL1/NOP2/fmu family ribosome biogenesis protein|nr:RsmB/NOP family class I SAM-dependent RNA methyltransferase [Candidatus Symbiothrix sp.]
MELPEIFISRTKALLGAEWEAFEQALEETSPTSIRLNQRASPPAPSPQGEGKKPVQDRTPQPPLLVERGQGERLVPWASNAYYLDSRPSFTLDPLFHAGCYYVQEASSMFLEQVINKHISQPVKVLDLCAAPGGKSTQLVSVLPEGSLLVANEVIRSRSYILAENLIKWGNPHTIVTNNDPSAMGKLDNFFDVIVADVPCSGEGMFRKDPGAIHEWSIHNVQLCAERQRRIIADGWPALRPGGLLIYSTCTYNREENEDNIAWICKELGAEITEEPHRFMPHRTKGEGFFIAAAKKNEPLNPLKGTLANARNRKGAGSKSPLQGVGGKSPLGVESWLTNFSDFSIFSENNTFTAIPSIHSDDYLFLKNRLKIVTGGIPLGEMKGKDLIPAHALALSNFLSPAAFPALELDKEAALNYLRKEALQEIPPELPKGYIIVTYLGHPLGFIKNIGNRANNLYPQEWRIRMKISG